jgi:hypothetical protein
MEGGQRGSIPPMGGKALLSYPFCGGTSIHIAWNNRMLIDNSWCFGRHDWFASDSQASCHFDPFHCLQYFRC